MLWIAKLTLFFIATKFFRRFSLPPKYYSYSHIGAFLKRDEKKWEDYCDVKKNVYLCHIK
jgi:hypothetical protein